MKEKSHNKYAGIAAYVMVTIVIGALLIMLLTAARDYLLKKEYIVILQILNPFLYGFAFAYILNPLMNLFERKVFHRVRGRRGNLRSDAQLRRMLSLTATFISAAVLISLIALMVFPQVGASLNQLAGKITDLFSPAEVSLVSEEVITGADTGAVLAEGDLDALLMEELGNYGESLSGYEALMSTKLGVYISNTAASIQRFISRFGLNMDIEQTARDLFLGAAARTTVFLGDYFQTIFNTTASFIVSTARQVLNIVVAIIVAFYILSDKERLISQLKRLLYALLPTPFVNKAVDITRKTHRIFGGFITGKLLDSLIIGILCFLCMSLFRINYPMLISVIVGITNIIPFFGPFIGAIPSIMFLMINDFGQGIWFMFFILILQQVDGNIIGPKIIGSTIGLSPFWVIFSILVMNGLLGPLGMFIGVPVFAVIYTLLKEYTSARLVKKGLPSASADWETDAQESLPVQPPSSGGPSKRRVFKMIERLSKNVQSLINGTHHEDHEPLDAEEDSDDDAHSPY